MKFNPCVEIKKDSCYLDSMAAGEMVRAVHSVVRGMGRFDIRVD